MYLLTFRVRVTTPRSTDEMERPRRARSRRVDFIAGEGRLRRYAYCVRRAVGLADYRWAPPRISKCCHSNTTRASIANPPNSEQLGGIPHHSPKLYLGPCNSVGMRPRTDTQTDRQTHSQTRVTTIHFASSTTHAKCNNLEYRPIIPVQRRDKTTTVHESTCWL